MNARSIRLMLLVPLAIVSAQAGVLNDISTYTHTGRLGGLGTSESGWTLVIVLFDSGGAVSDVSSHNDFSYIDLSTAGLSASYFTSNSGDSQVTDEPLATLDHVEAPAFDQVPTAVPEPSTFVLFGLGAAALIWYRRR